MMPNSHADTFQPLLVEREAAVCRLVLNRPEALNAITADMLGHLEAALADIEQDAALRVVVLTGAGRGFCAGADLKDLGSRTHGLDDSAASEANAEFSARLGRFLARLEALPKPVLAAVNGVAVAGGLELLLCCDLVLAAESARIGDAHSNYGLLPGGGSTARLPRRVGRSFAKYLLYTGDILPAHEFVAAGLVWKVVDDASLPSEVTGLAGRLASRSPLVLRELKRLVDTGMEGPLSAALRQEYEANRAHAGSHDRREGLAAFAERRPPRFTGN